MPEPTRRDLLETGAVALTGIAGCLENDESGSPPAQNNTNNSSTVNRSGESNTTLNEDTPTETDDSEDYRLDEDPLDLLIDPKELTDSGAADREKNYEALLFPLSFTTIVSTKDLYETLPDFRKEEIHEGLNLTRESSNLTYNMHNVEPDSVLTHIDDYAGVHTFLYDDLDETDVVSNLDESFNQFEEHEIDTRGWRIYRAQNVEDDFGQADIIAAVKGNAAIFAPEYEQPGGRRFIIDNEEATQTAIDTYESQLDSLGEGDELRDETMTALTSFIRDNDLEEVENPHIYEGGLGEIPKPEYIEKASDDRTMAFFNLTKVAETGHNIMYNDSFNVNKNGEIEDAEIDPGKNRY